VVTDYSIGGFIMGKKDLDNLMYKGEISLDHSSSFYHQFNFDINACSPLTLVNSNGVSDFLIREDNSYGIVELISGERKKFPFVVHSHFISFSDSYVALKTKNNREIINLNGEVVAEFPEPVDGYITLLSDGSFVALESEKFSTTKIISTNGKTYQEFPEDVWPGLVSGDAEGEFHALMISDSKTVLSNLFDYKNKKYGSLPRFSKVVGGDYGSIVSVNGVFVSLNECDDQSLIGTDNIIYGRFLSPVHADSLIYSGSRFYASDGENVLELSYKNNSIQDAKKKITLNLSDLENALK